MRVMLDSSVWADLEADEEFRDEFESLYEAEDLDVIFSIGNFLDIVRYDDRGDLVAVIDEFADEYLAPLQIDLEGEYRYSSKPLLLATIDAEWFEHCKEATRDLDSLETLQTLFREANFDDGPILSKVSRFVEEYSGIEDTNLEAELGLDEDLSPMASLKKIRTFPSYIERTIEGTMDIDDDEIPVKRYVVGMAMIYVSETYDDPGEADYRSAVIWSQAIIAGCDVLWTDRQWQSDHPLVKQVVERLDREYVEFAADFDEFEALVSA